jgi:polyhydroxyalkanoate synthesis regulator phasin
LADRIQAVLDDMGIPSREQLARLNREIDLLNEKIDGELQARMVRA